MSLFTTRMLETLTKLDRMHWPNLKFFFTNVFFVLKGSHLTYNLDCGLFEYCPAAWLTFSKPMWSWHNLFVVYLTPKECIHTEHFYDLMLWELVPRSHITQQNFPIWTLDSALLNVGTSLFRNGQWKWSLYIWTLRQLSNFSWLTKFL